MNFAQTEASFVIHRPRVCAGFSRRGLETKRERENIFFYLQQIYKFIQINKFSIVNSERVALDFFFLQRGLIP